MKPESRKIDFDVDIDVKNRDELIRLLDVVPAAICDEKTNSLRKHNTGVYFQDIPEDKLLGHSTIDHKDAEELGYFKIDILNLSIYSDVENHDDLDELMEEPIWELLEYDEIVSKLFHVHEYGELLKKLKPRSVEELAMVLAIIRPSKAYLRNSSWDRIRAEVWIPPKDGSYYFKKSHSIAYSMTIVVQMNIIAKKLKNGCELCDI